MKRIGTLGDSIWSKIYDLTPKSDIPNYIEETSDSGFILTGESDYELNFGSKFLTMKTDKSGDSIWTKQIGVGVYNTGHWIYQSSDDGYIAGATISDMFTGTSSLFKMNSLGDTIWSKSGVAGPYSSKCSDGGLISGSGYDDVNAILQTFDDNYIALCRNISSCYPDTFNYLMKIDSYADTIWKKKFPSNYTLYSLQQTKDSGFVLTGIYKDGTNDDILLIKIDSNGNLPASVKEISEKEKAVLYPNPFSTSATIRIENYQGKNVSLKIYNVFGQIMRIINAHLQTHFTNHTNDTQTKVCKISLQMQRKKSKNAIQKNLIYFSARVDTGCNKNILKRWDNY